MSCTDHHHRTLVRTFLQIDHAVGKVCIAFINQCFRSVWRELMELFECHLDNVRVGQFINGDLVDAVRCLVILIVCGKYRLHQCPDEFDFFQNLHPAPEPGKRNPDITVDENEPDAALFGKSDCLFHLGARFNPDVHPDLALDIGQNPLYKHEGEVAFQQVPYLWRLMGLRRGGCSVCRIFGLFHLLF